MLHLSRKDLAANLAAYGEQEASARIDSLSSEDYERIGKIGFQYALAGKHWFLAGCLAAIEVLEGTPRALKRKRRVWDDVDRELCEPDPRLAEIHAWFEAYAGGIRLKPRQIFDGLAAALAPCLAGYRYFKSVAEFRRRFDRGTSYVKFTRGHGVVELRFGVGHDEVERVKQALFGTAGVHGPFNRSISMFTANIGPQSPHWPYTTRPAWPIAGSEGLERAKPEVVAFVEDAVLPYLSVHEDPVQIRETLRNTPRRADPFFPSRTLFAIDHLLRRRDWLDADNALLTERAKNFHAEGKADLAREFAEAAAKWDDVL
jgi:hypothetical protein